MGVLFSHNCLDVSVFWNSDFNNTIFQYIEKRGLWRSCDSMGTYAYFVQNALYIKRYDRNSSEDIKYIFLDNSYNIISGTAYIIFYIPFKIQEFMATINSYTLLDKFSCQGIFFYSNFGKQWDNKPVPNECI